MRAWAAALLAAAVPAAAVAGAGPVHAATAQVAPVPAVSAPSPAPVPACPTAVARATGTGTTPPTPLPSPASSLGGERLARPGLQVDVPAGSARPPALRAAAWVVVDLTADAVVASCNAHVPLAPASTLKVLTTLALHPRLDAARRYRATRADASVEGSKVGLVAGSVYTMRDLWHGLLLGSGNDAANALAAMAGGMPAATRLMTEKARELGAADTVVANTSGLDAPGQVSSVYDLAVFGRAALADPAVRALVGTQRYRFPGAGTDVRSPRRARYEIQNHNRLLGGYQGTTGIKNGFTRAAGGSLVASATRGNRTYLVALLRTDTGTWRMARSLLDWAFSTGAAARPVGALARGPVPPAGSVAATGTPTASPGGTPSSPPPGTQPGGTAAAQVPVASATAGTVSASATASQGEGPSGTTVAAVLAIGAACGAGLALTARRVHRRRTVARP